MSLVFVWKAVTPIRPCHLSNKQEKNARVSRGSSDDATKASGEELLMEPSTGLRQR